MKPFHAPIWALLLGLPFLTCSCSEPSSSTNGPLPPDPKGEINAHLPAYVSVESVQLDDAGEGTYKFKAVAVTREPLYTADVKQPDLSALPFVPAPPPDDTQQPLINPRPLTVLEMVNKKDETISLYGTLHAEKMVDKWTYSDVQVESGLTELGQPRGSFPPGAVVEGTPEYTTAFEAWKQSTEDYRQKVAAAAAAIKAAGEKILQEKQRQASDQRDKLLKAAFPGAQYLGQITWEWANNPVQDIGLTFVTQKSSLVTLKLSNPSDPRISRAFSGKIDLDAPKDGQSYVLNCGPDAAVSVNGAWDIYTQGCVLHLRPTENGWEGLISTDGIGGGHNYKLDLQRVETTTSHDGPPTSP
jgi:hypothetical protein